MLKTKKPLKEYIGQEGYIPQSGWNFSSGKFRVIDIGTLPYSLKIFHEQDLSSGDYNDDFIISCLNNQ